MENNKAIEIKDLVIDYGSSIAVNKINLEVEKGDLVTLLGPSGCGKSTTLNALAGLITTTSGKIYFDGRNVTRFSPKERDIGLVFQSYALYPHMTVYKNIAFPLLANDKFKEEINNKNKEYELEILKFKYESTGLKDFDEKIKAYSEFEKSTKEVEEKIETIKYKANNATKNAKELKKIARIRKEGSIKNTSEEALKFIKENDKLIELIKKEADSIKRTDLSNEQKEKKLSKLRDKIQKLNLSSQKKFDDHSVKIKEIKETFKKDFANAKSEEKRILSEVKVWMDTELNKLSVEKNEIDSKLKELSVKSLTEIKAIAKEAKLNEEQKKQLREIENKKKSWKVELDNRVRTVAERVGITSQLEKKVTNLSGGQQQRVAISRTLVKKPKVLLLDEPLSNLDAKMRVQTREWIRDLQQELGITTVFVTHDQEEAMSISDKIVCMSDGHIQQVAEPMFMYHNPANKFVAGFLGMPQMNFFEEGSEITDQIKKLLKNKKAHSFGIRPEHVKVISEAKKNELHPLKLEGEVSITESFGREKLVTLLVGNETIKFFTEITDLDRGDKVKIGFKKERIYMFDNKGFGETLGRK